MRLTRDLKALGAVALGVMVMAAGGAAADTTYTIDKVTITGSQTVPVQKLYDAISIHKGSHATKDDIVADQSAIEKVLSDNHVVGSIKTSMTSRGNHVSVLFTIVDQGAQAPTVTHIAPKLHEEIFDGNKALDSATLTAASGLRPGDELSNEKVQAAQKAIAAAYTAAKKPVSISLSGEVKALPGATVDIIWHIKETKAKPKPSGESSESQD